jgi:hypothetical protein
MQPFHSPGVERSGEHNMGVVVVVLAAVALLVGLDG